MLMFGKRHKDNGEKIFRYSIRKYHFGAASVAIAALIFFANGVAQAETLPVRPETANVQSSPEGERSDSGGRAVSEIQPAEQPKVLTQSVNKDALRIAIGNLSDVVRKVESSKLVALESQLTQVVEESKRLLEDGDATEQAVATEVETIKALIREVEKLLPKSEPTVDEPADKKDKEASIEHPKDEKKVVSDQEKSKKDLSIVDKAKLNEDKAAVNQGSEDRLTSNPNKVAKKELPTYSNENDGATNLSNELYFIYGELKKANTDTSKIQEVKDAYDRINNAIPLANNGVINQAIFDAALVDLKKARDLIESVLNGKTTDNSTTTPVNPQPRSDDEELPSRGRGRTRTTRTVREGTENYANSLESYFEDGKKGVSPYDKYTYVFYSRRQAGVYDGANRRVEEARNQIYADVTPTNDGFRWDIHINRSKYDLSDAVSWFTIPNGQDLKSGSVNISWSSESGNEATSPNDGTISGALRAAGFKNVTEGTPTESRVDKSGTSTVNKKYNSRDLRALSQTGGTTGYNPYDKRLESGAEKTLASKKFDVINSSGGKLYYFELNQDLRTYHLSFETRGNNDINKLAYAVGMKGERTDDDNPRLRTRFLVNQWYARTNLENTYADQYTPTITYPTYIVKQGEYKNQAYGHNPNWERHPENTTALLNYDSYPYNKANFDANNYYYFKNDAGESSEEILRKANEKGFNDNFKIFKSDGREISKREMGSTGADVPGMHEYTWKWTFRDGSVSTKRVKFAVIPKTPVLETNLNQAGGKKNISIVATNGTQGVTMELYRKVGNTLTKVASDVANERGQATFIVKDERNNPKALELGTYVVKTVVDIPNAYRDYRGTLHTRIESDASNEKTATDGVPPVVSVNDKVLPTNKSESNPVLYEVTQGERFNPTIKVWDNSGTINNLSIANTPGGIDRDRFNRSFSRQTTAEEANQYTAPTLEGTVSSTQRPGIHIAEISTSDAHGNSQTYYFKYKVKPTQPSVSTPLPARGSITIDTVPSTARTLTGTGIPGATIKVKVAGKEVPTTTVVNGQGKWELQLTKGLNSNQTGQNQLVDKDSVTVTQSVDGIESSEKSVPVSLGETTIQPTVVGGTSVYAGAKTIEVKAPHDAGIVYVSYRDKATGQGLTTRLV